MSVHTYLSTFINSRDCLIFFHRLMYNRTPHTKAIRVLHFLSSPSACGRAELLRTEIGGFFLSAFTRCYFGITFIIFVTNFCDEFCDEFLFNVLIYSLNLLTIASFRSGVPSILFFHVFWSKNSLHI